MIDNETFKKFVVDSKQNNRILYDPEFLGEYKDILEQIYKDSSNFDSYTLSGQFEDILIKVTNSYLFKDKTNYYNDFMSIIYSEFEKLKVPNIILIPLNNLSLNFYNKDFIEITDKIRIYNSINPIINRNYPNKKIKKDKLCEYYEQSIYAELSKEHIILTKDPNFFNSPIMTIVVDNINYKVSHEASRITEAVYSFIRMIDFDAERDLRDLGLIHKKLKPAHTYGVYYNLPGTKQIPPYDNGYGHSYIFKFEPILDVLSNEFENRIKSFSFILDLFVKYSFINRNLTNPLTLKKIDKWMNAVLLYNSAYELASKEKYDLTIITLLTILESLFLKNTGDKKLQLAEKIPEFLIKRGFKYNKEKLQQLLKETYSHRNKFVHEGDVYYNMYSYKGLHDRQGLIPGMKPFNYGMVPCNSQDDARSIYMLFRITGYVIISFWN